MNQSYGLKLILHVQFHIIIIRILGENKITTDLCWKLQLKVIKTTLKKRACVRARLCVELCSDYFS